MNRIQEIRIVIPAYSGPRVNFLDAIDIECGFSGTQHRPSWKSLEILRRLAHEMVVDIDFVSGITTLRRPTPRALELATPLTGENFSKLLELAGGNALQEPPIQ